MGAKQSYPIEIAVKGQKEAEVLWNYLISRPDFISATGPAKKKRTKDIYTMMFRLPAGTPQK